MQNMIENSMFSFQRVEHPKICLKTIFLRGLLELQVLIL